MPVSMWTFIVFAVIAVIITVAALIFANLDHDPLPAAGAVLVIVSAWVVTAVPLLTASLTAVPTRNIGIVTNFGKPTGESLGNGLHWKAPWTKVAEMDGAVQNLTRTGEQATTVRLGNNSLAQVDNTIRWRIVPEAAPELYMDYRSFDGVRENLVVRQANAALNAVLGTFNPLTSLEEQQNENQNAKIAEQVAEVLRKQVGKQIIIEQVIIPVIKFDGQTQQRIDQFNAEVANTRVAEQRQKTAAADAAANRTLSDSVRQDPNVIVSRCVDASIKAGLSPAGCWPGTSVISGVK